MSSYKSNNTFVSQLNLGMLKQLTLWPNLKILASFSVGKWQLQFVVSHVFSVLQKAAIRVTTYTPCVKYISIVILISYQFQLIKFKTNCSSLSVAVDGIWLWHTIWAAVVGFLLPSGTEQHEVLCAWSIPIEYFHFVGRVQQLFKVGMKVVPKFRHPNLTRDQARVIHVAIVVDEQFSRCILSLGHSLYSTPMSSVCERAGSEWSRDQKE